MKDEPSLESDRKSKILLNIDEINFHPLLKDIEYTFWLFLLANKALSLQETQQILVSDIQFFPLLEKYNTWTKLKIEIDPTKKTYITKLNIINQMNILGKSMAVITYDYLLASKYNSQINQHVIMQFLRHIRNGAAHSNKFNLKDEKGDWKIKDKESIIWQDKKIDRKLHGTVVFPDFFSIFGMFLLAKDLSDMLFLLDKK